MMVVPPMPSPTTRLIATLLIAGIRAQHSDDALGVVDFRDEFNEDLPGVAGWRG